MGYSLSAHALLLENLACRAAGRETTAAALEGLVELLGLTADWLRGEQQWQQQAKTLQERWVPFGFARRGPGVVPDHAGDRRLLIRRCSRFAGPVQHG